MAESGVVARNSVIYVVASTVQKLSSLILLPLYTRLLSPDEYGYFNLITAFILFASVFGLLGLDHAVMRFCTPGLSDESEHKEQESAKSYFTASFVVVAVASSAVTIVLTLASPIYIEWVFPGLDFFPVVAVTATALLFQPIFALVLSLFQSRSNARAFAAYSFGYFVVNGILTVVFIGPLEFGLLGAAVALLVSNSCFALVTSVHAYRMGLFWGKFRMQDVAQLTNYGLPMVPHNASLQSTALATRVILSNVVSVAAVGLFNIAMFASNVIDAVQTALHRAYLPWFYREASRQNPGWHERVRTAILALVAINVVVASFVALFGDNVIALLAAPDFEDAALVVPVLAIGMMAKSTYYPSLATLLYEPSGPKLVFLISGLSGLVAIALALLGAYSFGIWGVAVALVAQRALMAFLAWGFARRFNAPGIPWAGTLKLQSLGLLIGATATLGTINAWWGMSLLAQVSAKLAAIIVVAGAALIVEPKLWNQFRRIIHRGD